MKTFLLFDVFNHCVKVAYHPTCRHVGIERADKFFERSVAGIPKSNGIDGTNDDIAYRVNFGAYDLDVAGTFSCYIILNGVSKAPY